MPWRPLCVFGGKKVYDDCRNDDSDWKYDIGDYVNISSLKIDVPFVLVMMALDFLLW